MEIIFRAAGRRFEIHAVETQSLDEHLDAMDLLANLREEILCFDRAVRERWPRRGRRSLSVVDGGRRTEQLE